MLIYRYRPTFQHVNKALDFQAIQTPNLHLTYTRTCSVLQTRRVRTKGGTDFYTNAQRKDERLLRRLEAQLANAQAKLKKEEQEAPELTKKQAHQAEAAIGGQTLKNYNNYFWEKILSHEDREKLVRYDIKSFDELYSVHEAAETAMSQPPYPSVNQLEFRLRYGHEIYESIPQRLSETGYAGTPFSGPL